MTLGLRGFAAICRDTWAEFRDARSLWLVLAVILVLFGVAATARFEPLPSGRTYLEFSARALSADLDDVDLAETSLTDILERLDGSLASIAAAEPLGVSAGAGPAETDPKDAGAAPAGVDGPRSSWRVTLVRTALPVVGGRLTVDDLQDRFGRVPDGRLWQVREIRETSGTLAAAVGRQTFELVVAPGADLATLWPHRLTLLGGFEVTPEQGAPLGLQVFILQKLLATGIGGTILLLVSVVITAGFVPAMLRRGTLELLLVRPLRRWQLLLFKYATALLFVAGLLGLLVVATWLVTGLTAGVWRPGILLAVSSLLLFFGLLLSVSVCAGVITRSGPAAMLVAVIYWAVLFVTGLMHAQVVGSRVREEMAGKPRPVTVAEALRGRTRPRPPLARSARPFHTTAVARVVEGLYAVLPHASDLDALVDRQLMRGFAVGGRLRRLVESGEFSWLSGLGLTLAHTTAFLAAACWIFSRRDP
jgi:ABC-type transport system involved in multi-copper enzyme maturation permease subunit